MVAKPVEGFDPYYPPDRRLAMFYVLIAEGIIENKSPEAITEDDFNQIDSRILLEDIAAKEGISIEQMFDNWEAELATARPCSAQEMIELLATDVARLDQ